MVKRDATKNGAAVNSLRVKNSRTIWRKLREEAESVKTENRKD